MTPRLRSRLLIFGGAATILIVDQLSKWWVVQTLPAYTPVDYASWLRSILSLTYVKNTGVAFGLFPQLGVVFTVLSALVVVGILFFQRTIPSEESWLHAALGLVIGGALGNLLDRVTRGYVVDFFDVNFWPLHNWPVFNVADSAIVVGVTILLIQSFFFEVQPEPEEITADA